MTTCDDVKKMVDGAGLKWIEPSLVHPEADGSHTIEWIRPKVRLTTYEGECGFMGDLAIEKFDFSGGFIGGLLGCSFISYTEQGFLNLYREFLTLSEQSQNRKDNG